MNSKFVRLETVTQRNCRFPDEKLENSVLPYSFSSCFTDKRIAMELELCNCTIHTSPVECKKVLEILKCSRFEFQTTFFLMSYR